MEDYRAEKYSNTNDELSYNDSFKDDDGETPDGQYAGDNNVRDEYGRIQQYNNFQRDQYGRRVENNPQSNSQRFKNRNNRQNFNQNYNNNDQEDLEDSTTPGAQYNNNGRTPGNNNPDDGPYGEEDSDEIE